MRGLYGQKPSMEKVDAIQRMKECTNTIEAQSFWGHVYSIIFGFHTMHMWQIHCIAC
jgi:hypothetical protein